MKSIESNHPRYPSTPETPLGQRLTFRGILNMILARWLVTSAVALLVAGLFALYFLTREPVYESRASLVVEINEDRVTQMEEVVDTSLQRGMMETIMNTHRERLRNRAFAVRVQEKLTPGEIEELYAYAGLDPDSLEVEPAEILRSEIVEVEWLPDTQVIELTARHSNPALAAKIAHLYTTEYIHLVLEQRQSGNDRAVNFIDQQAEDLRAGISESERALQAYRITHNLVSLEDNREVISRKLNQINEELTDERVRMIGLGSTMDEIEEAGTDRLELLSIQEVNSFEPIPELVVQLKNIENENEVLLQTYLSEHPVMKKNQAEKESILSAIDRSIDQAVSLMRRLHETGVRRETQLVAALGEAEREAQELDRLAIELNVLQRRLDTQEDTYTQLVQRLNETSISSQLKNTNIRLLEPANYPIRPVEPNVVRITLASGMIFFAVLITLPVAWEGVDTRLKTFAEIESFVGKPVIGHLQAIRQLSGKTVSDQMKQVEVLEGFRGIFAQISLEEENRPLSIMVSSTAPEEGKSFVSANLAVTCARHGLKTVLVDADLRRSSIHKLFNLQNTTGLTSFAKGPDPNFSNLGITRVAPMLDVVTSGGTTALPTELIRSDRFRTLMKDLHERYDAVIIDTPPVGPCPDALFIARSVNHTLFVVRQKANSRHKIRSAVRKLDRTSAPVLGIVLNRIVGHTADGAYANYRSEYGFNYGYSTSYYTSDEIGPDPSEKNETSLRGKIPSQSPVELMS